MTEASTNHMDTMRSTTTHRRARSLRLGLPALLLGAVGLPLAGRAMATTTAPRAVTAATPAMHLPAAKLACTSGAKQLDLYAQAVSATVNPANRLTLADGTKVGFLGFTQTDTVAPTAPGGPTLVVCQGDSVTITLHNQLAAASSLTVRGQQVPTDLAGAAPGGTADVSFTASRAGTYLYEAGQLAGAQYQTAMGLYGALVVLPTGTTNAYPSTDYAKATYAGESAYDADAALVISELDPALNNAANPAAFDMRDYHPTVGLVNGAPGTGATTFDVSAGQRVLLRYLNAGVQPHSMALLGLSERLIAYDGSPLNYPRDVVADTFGPGQTADAVVTIPATATTTSSYAVYDGSFTLHNGTAAGTAGLVAFLKVASALSGPPIVSNVVAAATTVTAKVTALGSATVTSAEYSFDGTSWASMTVPSAPAQAVVTATASYAALLPGTYTVQVRATDSTNAVSTAVSTTFTVAADTAAPLVTNVVVTPSATNGASVALSGKADDSATGGSAIASASYVLDGATPVPMTVTATGASSAQLSFAIPTASLTDGSHTVAVTATDAAGQTSTAVSTTFVTDKVAPTVTATAAPGAVVVNGSTTLSATIADAAPASGIVAAEYTLDGGAAVPMSLTSTSATAASATASVKLTAAGSHNVVVRVRDAAGNVTTSSTLVVTASTLSPQVGAITVTPNPTNGLVGVNAGNPSVRVQAPMSQQGAAIAAVEMTIDTTALTPAIVMSPLDGAFNTSSEVAYYDMTLTSVRALAEGTHTVRVRARDALGNWGPQSAGTFVVDKTGPTTSATITITPAAPINASAVTVAASASDPAGIDSGEMFIDTVGVYGTGITMTPSGNTLSGTIPAATIAALSGGNHTLYVHAKDKAGNWGATVSTVLNGDRIFADGFESGNTAAWTNASTNNAGRLSVTAAAALVGTQGLQAQANNTNYVTYTFGTTQNPAATSFDARFSFRPNGAASTGKDIFVGLNGGTTLFRVGYRLNGSQPQVQIALGTTGYTTAGWRNITGGATTNTIEVQWRSAGTGSPATLTLVLNGVTQTGALTPTSTAAVSSFRLGSVTNAGGNGTAMYFDAVSIKRSLV